MSLMIVVLIIVIIPIIIISLLSFIGYIVGKKKSISSQQKELEEYRKKLLIQEKRNERLNNELADNLVRADELVRLIKEEDEKVNLIIEHEEMRKKKHLESVFMQDYYKEDEVGQKLTNVVAAQIFTTKKTKELSEEEKLHLINNSIETEDTMNENHEHLYNESQKIKNQFKKEIKELVPTVPTYNGNEGGNDK